MKRILAVVFGFFSAALAALIVFFWAGGHWAAREFQNEFDRQDAYYDMPALVDGVTLAFQAAPAMILLPPAAAVLLGEIFQIRSALYYIAAGGVAAALMPVAMSTVSEAPGGPLSAQFLAIAATAGFAAGFVYWLIAGRRS